MEGKEGKIFCQSMTDDERRNVFGEGYFAYLAKISKKKGAMVGYIIAFLAVGVLCNIPGWGFRIDMDLIMDGTHEVSAITVVLGVLLMAKKLHSNPNNRHVKIQRHYNERGQTGRLMTG